VAPMHTTLGPRRRRPRRRAASAASRRLSAQAARRRLACRAAALPAADGGGTRSAPSTSRQGCPLLQSRVPPSRRRAEECMARRAPWAGRPLPLQRRALLCGGEAPLPTVRPLPPRR
jgi:hypothetical protein